MIAPTSFFSDYGGHIRILEETRALQAHGVQVAIVTYHKGNDVLGLDIRRTRPLPWHTDYEVGSSRHKIAFDAYLAYQSLREFRRFRPDIIHGHMHEGALIGGALSKAFGVPLVFDFQGSLTAEMVDHKFITRNGLSFQWLLRMERFITRRLPDAILTSSGTASDLLRDTFSVPDAMIHPLPDCADPVQFDPARFDYARADHPLRRQLALSDDTRIVGYLGLLTDYQGIPHIIEAAAALRRCDAKVHFLVMGYPNVDTYTAQAESAGIGDIMTFTGRIAFDDAPFYLSACDITVAPKVSTSEGSGKLLNYMAMARPVVVYDTPVNREYLAGLGEYAPVGDVAAFTAVIERLLADPEYGRRRGAALRRRAIENYSWDAASQRIRKVYEGLTRAR